MARQFSISANVVYDFGYRCRVQDPRDEREEGCIRAYWTGEIDTWGKHTITPVDGSAPLYLFRDEMVDVQGIAPHRKVKR